MRLCSVLFLAVLPVVLVPAALAAHTHVPTPSTWTLNLAKSDFGGGPGMKSEVETITVDTDKWLSYRDVTIEDNGKKTTSIWRGPADGTLHPIKGMPEARGSWDSATDRSVVVMPDGSEMHGTLSMPTPKQIVFQIDVKDTAGHTYHQTLLYDRTR